MQSLQKGKKIRSSAEKNKKLLTSVDSPKSKEFAWAATSLIVLLFGSFFIYDSSIRDPFLAPRFLFMAVFLAAALYWFLVHLKWEIPVSKLLTRCFIGASIAFLVWNVLCTNQALNISESIFFICREILFFLSFLLMLVLLYHQKNLLLIPKALTLVLMVFAAIGVLQYYTIAFTFIPGDLEPTGISGNRNLYASFLVLLLPFAFYTLIFARRIWKLVGAMAISMGMLAIILGQTRSAWLAFLVAALLFQIGFLIIRKKLPKPMVRNWLWGSLSGIVILVVALGIVLLTDTNGEMQTRLKSRIQSLYALNDLDDTNEAARNINERLLVWSGTAKMIQDAPLMGWGPGNWRLVFPQYGGMSASEDGSTGQMDKVRVQPHNVYLHVASETGIPGLLLVLVLGSLTFLAAFTNIKRSTEPKIILLNLLLACGIIALAVDMLFSFPNERMEHGILAALLAALIFSSLEKSNTAAAKTFLLPGSAYFFAALPVLIFCMALGSAKWRFDYYLMKILESELKKNYTQVLEDANKGKSKLVTLDPVSDPMEFHAARAYIAMGKYDKALEEITLAERFHPNSHRIYNTKAVIYLQQNQYKEAIEPLKKALQYSPAYPPALQNLAYSYYRTDQYQASLDVISKLDIRKDTLLQKMEADLKRRLANEKPNTDDHH